MFAKLIPKMQKSETHLMKTQHRISKNAVWYKRGAKTKKHDFRCEHAPGLKVHEKDTQN